MIREINKVSIIGLGLIGSSILHAFKIKFENKFQVFAYDKNLKHRNIIKKMEIADKVCDNIIDSVVDADLIILSVPVGSMGIVAKQITSHLKPGAILTDTGSTKLSDINDIKPFLPQGVFFIPSHPLAGTEHSGPESGFASLFENRYWIIISKKRNQQTNILESIFLNLGAKIEYMDAQYHDKIMALTSHLPHLIAFTIVGTASQLEKDLKNDVIRFSATGFRDFTRLASSDPTMWRDVFTNNGASVLEMLQRFNEDLTYLQKLIRQKNGEKLRIFFQTTRNIRSKIINAGQHEQEDLKKFR